MKKKGVSHIEIILSFLLFVGFVGAALYFFSPVDSSRLVDSTLSYSFREIQENVSVGVDSYSVKINSDIYLGVREIIAIGINGISSEKKVRVEDKNGVELPSSRIGDKVIVDRGSENFVFVKFSEDYINDGILGDVELNESEYELASFSSREEISERRFSDLIDLYGEDVVGLKEDFNLPNRIDFGFSLRYSGGGEIGTEDEVPGNVEVFSDFRQVVVLRDGGESEFGDLVVRIW
tara:strand:- start:5541 stop:6245 length:705 start_codon:yes stop_codon:yes gene_type:complete